MLFRSENRTRIYGFGVLSTLLVAAVLTNTLVNFGLSDRLAFFALVMLGMGMCAMGRLGQGAIYGWANPLHISGYGFGILNLMITAAVLFKIPLPWIADERSAIVALGVLMLVKLGIAQLYRK